MSSPRQLNLETTASPAATRGGAGARAGAIGEGTPGSKLGADRAGAVRVVVLASREQIEAAPARRLLNALSTDARFVLAQVFVVSERSDTPDSVPAWLLRLEALAASGPSHVQSPAWDLHRRLYPPISLPDKPEAVPACDVLIDLAGTAPDALAKRAEFGLWRLPILNSSDNRAATEVLRGKPSVTCELVQVSFTAPPRLLGRAKIQSKVTVGRSLDFAREKSVQLILRELGRVAQSGAPTDLGPASTPSSPPAGRALSGYTSRVLRETVSRARMSLSCRLGGTPRPFALRLGYGSLADFDPAATVDVPNSDGEFRADPFLFEKDGALYCFYESYSYRTNLGHIAVARVDGDRFDVIGPAVQRPYHLSYPFVFENAGEIYMLPETHQANRLEIWRCTDFPTGWELHATAMEGAGAVDSVLVQRGEDWWLFANLCNDSIGDRSSELHLFRADGPELRKLEQHPLNPVVVGSDIARGGGRVVEIGGRLLRSSQDNSGSVYGYGWNLMEITALTPTDYRERPIRHLTPDFAPGLIGCHHVDAAAGRVVIDVRLR